MPRKRKASIYADLLSPKNKEVPVPAFALPALEQVFGPNTILNGRIKVNGGKRGSKGQAGRKAVGNLPAVRRGGACTGVHA